MNKLAAQKSRNLKNFFFQWEWVLVLLFILINVINSTMSPNYLNASKLITATRSFLDKAFIVLPMCMVLLMGEIDISVGSTVALSSTFMAICHCRLGWPMGAAILVCLITGLACGLLNGILLTRFAELPPMIVTFVGQLLFRGIAKVLLEGEALNQYPDWFSALGWSNFLGVPIIFWAVLVFIVIFYFLVQRSKFGRYIYAIGSNRIAAKYSGINVARVRMTVYAITGFMAAVCAIFLTSRTTSTRADIARGYEMEVITMVILGGISSAGGKGNIIGAVISIFIIGFLRYGLGFANINSDILTSIIGALLVISALIPNILFNIGSKKKKVFKEKME